MVTSDFDIIDIDPELQEAAIIKQQLNQSIQEFPDATKQGGGLSSWYSQEVFKRVALLPARGSYGRLEWERRWYYHEDNSMFRDIISGLIKRIQSMPYEVKSDADYGERWDLFLRHANFKDWETFISQLVLNYSIYDIGAFIEIIAPGNPKKPPTGAATGMAVLDSRRCTLTGDPLFPVIYTAANGKMNLMHTTRVIQIVDTEEKNDEQPGWGDSALSRCITAIYREILAAAYMRASLDDMPAPGFAIAKNLTEKQVMQQIVKMQEKRENDKDMLGRIVFLYGADTSQVPNLEFQQFQKEFTGFEPDKVSSMNAKYMAAGVGVDLQDFWELTGKGIGTATQSEILAQKSKGRALGRLLKAIERAINDIFPVDVEFTFLYRNEEEDLQLAQTAQTWVTAIEQMTTISADERRIMYANQIPAVADAITDKNGTVIRWDDADPKTEEQADPVDEILPAPGETQPVEEAPDANLATPEQKDYRRTRRNFIDTFNLAVKFLQQGDIGVGNAVVLIMDELQQGGREAMLDGMKRAGRRRPAIDDSMERELASWLARQRPLVRRFIGDVQNDKFSDKEITRKGLVWANSSLEEMLYRGMIAGKPRKLWKWRINASKENCRTCLGMNGQVHLMQSYIKSGLVPKSSILVCGGFECGCRLSAVPPGTKAKGRLSAVKTKGYGHYASTYH